MLSDEIQIHVKEEQKSQDEFYLKWKTSSDKKRDIEKEERIKERTVFRETHFKSRKKPVNAPKLFLLQLQVLLFTLFLFVLFIFKVFLFVFFTVLFVVFFFLQGKYTVTRAASDFFQVYTPFLLGVLS